jgi:hypothetical protein
MQGRPVRSSDRDRVILLALGFRHDPKIQALSDTEYRAWTNVLFDQLEFGNGTSELRSVLSPRRCQRFLDLGLLKRTDDGRIYVNAWDEWNGRAAWKRYLNRQRQQRFRDKRRNA